MSATKKDKNPYKICTWQTETECAGCALSSTLKCRFNWGDLSHFMGIFIMFAIPSIIGVVLGGWGWYLLGWFAFAMFFFHVWESYILCRHCPYYAEEDKTLHCIANYGVYKLWKYAPQPMNRSEKTQLFIGFFILFGYPFPFMLISGQYLYALVAFWAAVMFFWTLRKDTCSQCVNFSCPLNTVPKERVDAYLELNPVMRDAWGKDTKES